MGISANLDEMSEEEKNFYYFKVGSYIQIIAFNYMNMRLFKQTALLHEIIREFVMKYFLCSNFRYQHFLFPHGD